METYLIKMILSSAIFIGFYYLVLEQQKSHHFKRFYLLSSILFSLLIPFASITYGVEQSGGEGLILMEQQGGIIAYETVRKSIFTAENIIYGIYLLMSFILLMRFLISLYSLRNEIVNGTKVRNGDYFLVLKENKESAHSFWKYIFLNRKDFEQGKVDEKIIRHEELHLKEKHSLDILFIEFLLVVFWFNPAFYLYRKAILTNHEFLADEYVLKSETNIRSYQHLLLTELISERILFTNQFNLSNTKKRIKMMTTPNTKKSKFYSLISLPLAAVMFFIFAEKVPAKADKINSKSEINEVLLPEVKSEIYPANKLIEDEIFATKIIKSDTVKYSKEAERKAIEAQQKTSAKLSEVMADYNAKVAELKKIQEANPNKPERKLDDLNDASGEVDKLPSYPEGLHAFRSKIGMAFKTEVFNGDEGTIKTTAYFTVEEDGRINNISAVGDNEKFNNEISRTVMEVTGNTKWTPAVKDGKPVKYRFKLPMTMNFEFAEPLKKK